MPLCKQTSAIGQSVVGRGQHPPTVLVYPPGMGRGHLALEIAHWVVAGQGEGEAWAEVCK